RPAPRARGSASRSTPAAAGTARCRGSRAATGRRSPDADRRRPPGLAPPRRWPRPAPRSRPPAGSGSGRAGSAGRRRRRESARRASAPRRLLLGCQAVAPARLAPRGLGSRRRALCGIPQRELDYETRALPHLRLDADAPAVQLEKAARDREPQARALVLGPCAGGAIERQKDALVFAARDSRPLIDDQHPYAVAHGAGAYRHGLLAGVSRGVLQHVREGPLELTGIAVKQRHAGFDRELEQDRVIAHLLDRLLQHLVDRIPHQPRLGAAGLQHRQVEELLDQLPEASRRVEYLLAHVGHVLAGWPPGVE